MKNMIRIVLWMLTLFVSSMWVEENAAQNASVSFQVGRCIQSFDAFAFHSSNPSSQETASRFSDWQIEAELPREESLEDVIIHYYQNINISLSRLYNGQQEIWITGHIYMDLQFTPLIIIFRPDSQSWDFLTANIGDTELYVNDLYVDNRNVIWGRTTWPTILQERSELDSVPVLSRYNEITQRFEVAEGVLEIPLPQEEIGVSTSVHQTIILLYNNNIFWIFAQGDGLYRYNPTTQITEQQAQLSDIFVDSIAVSPDGIIYFSTYGNRVGLTIAEIFTSRESFTLAEGNLLRFIPQTGEIESLPTPNETWPMFSGMLFDRQGRLWLGSVGYLESNGTWHLIHPDPEEYFENVADYTWRLPVPILESTDGLLWFNKFLDTGGQGEGTAWYDPQTAEGCLVTTYPTNIVEDANQQLWMVVHGALYRYSINAD